MKSRSCLLVALTVVVVLPPKTDQGFQSVKFLTDAFYKDSVLDLKPLTIVEMRTLQQCQALCASRASCKAFAFGGLCVSQCRLYDSNLCLNASIKVTAKVKSFVVWDKVDLKANFSCYADSTFKKCLKTMQGRCGGCRREGFHGPNCEFYGRGCPKRYEFHNGSCAFVSSAKTSFKNVDDACAANAGGRFGLVRNLYANAMLQAWAKSLGLTDGVYIGVEKTAGHWTRKDGRTLDEEGVYDNWWKPLQPSESVQRVVVMEKDMDFSYNDDMDFELRDFFCEVDAENCTAFPLQVNDTVSGTCYNLHTLKVNFTSAISACELDNGTLAKVRDTQTHKMLADFLRLKKLDSDVYVGILANKSLDFDAVYFDGTPVNFRLPWGANQPNAWKETVVLLTAANGQWNDVLLVLAHGYACEYIAKSCSDWHRYRLLEDGPYRLLPNGTEVDFDVRCDMSSSGGGWTVIQRRVGDVRVSFNRTFNDYEKGFGHLDSDFWLGLNKVRLLTAQEAVHLRVEMVDANNASSSIVYSNFRVKTTSYVLTVGRVLANPEDEASAADGLTALNGSSFLTFDLDGGQQCASASGGWWSTTSDCPKTRLNGLYPGSASGSDSAMQWEGTQLTSVQMMVKSSAYFGH